MWDVLLSLGYALVIGLAVLGVAVVINYLRYVWWAKWGK